MNVFKKGWINYSRRKKISRMRVLRAKTEPANCGDLSNISCRSWEARPCFFFCPWVLRKLTNNTRWSRRVTHFNPEMVLQSHIRASARPAEIIADQITVSNSFNRRILSLVESSSETTSFRVGSDKNRLIIFFLFYFGATTRIELVNHGAKCWFQKMQWLLFMMCMDARECVRIWISEEMKGSCNAVRTLTRWTKKTTGPQGSLLCDCQPGVVLTFSYFEQVFISFIYVYISNKINFVLIKIDLKNK